MGGGISLPTGILVHLPGCPALATPLDGRAALEAPLVGSIGVADAQSRGQSLEPLGKVIRKIQCPFGKCHLELKILSKCSVPPRNQYRGINESMSFCYLFLRTLFLLGTLVILRKHTPSDFSTK